MTRRYVSTPRTTQALMISQKVNRRLTGLVTWVGGEPETEVERLVKRLCEAYEVQATDDGFLYYKV
ncbi:hypothetical protein SAMN04487936_107205 [Halobacillus dabanensis]|uniref:Uncharacterized protein n=1 Tax=Halobacillus dabanensis TaxID=240302 RepID=A0A1I3WXU0_HALDA|nr:hypothetical protein SAMN04487936_107205 [Halobacillus dabanensis]